jgi:hypothetical protein
MQESDGPRKEDPRLKPLIQNLAKEVGDGRAAFAVCGFLVKPANRRLLDALIESSTMRIQREMMNQPNTDDPLWLPKS